MSINYFPYDRRLTPRAQELRHDMTPQELFSFIMKSTGATMPVRGSGKGQGKGQAAQ